MKVSTVLAAPLLSIAVSGAAFADNAITRAAEADHGLFVPEISGVSSMPADMADATSPKGVNRIVASAEAERGEFAPQIMPESIDYQVAEMGEHDYNAPNSVIESAVEDSGLYPQNWFDES